MTVFCFLVKKTKTSQTRSFYFHYFKWCVELKSVSFGNETFCFFYSVVVSKLPVTSATGLGHVSSAIVKTHWKLIGYLRWYTSVGLPRRSGFDWTLNLSSIGWQTASNIKCYVIVSDTFIYRNIISSDFWAILSSYSPYKPTRSNNTHEMLNCCRNRSRDDVKNNNNNWSSNQQSQECLHLDGQTNQTGSTNVSYSLLNIWCYRRSFTGIWWDIVNRQASITRLLFYFLAWWITIYDLRGIKTGL